MTRSVYAALAIALALAGVVAWECSDAPTADVPLSPPRPLAEIVGGQPAAPETPEARQGHFQTQVTAVLARPLFNLTRRPPQGAASAAPSEPMPPRLTGILVSQAGRQAIFAPAAGGRAIAAYEGSHVGVFVVSAIAAGEVTVLGPDGGTRVLRPKADPAARAAAAPAVQVAQTAPSSVLDLLRGIPGDGTRPGPPRAARPEVAR